MKTLVKKYIEGEFIDAETVDGDPVELLMEYKKRLEDQGILTGQPMYETNPKLVYGDNCFVFCKQEG